MFCPITKNNLGIAREFTSPKEYADAILSLVNMDTTVRQEMCNRVRSTAYEYDYKALTNHLIRLIED